MKKYLVSGFLVLALLFVPATVSAAEINPDSSTYGYGSTSEHSSEVIATQGSSLASTGDPAKIITYVAIGLVLVGGGAVVYLAMKKRRS